ncbi:MAG TPA: GNAT family N-acetyltransferase [Gammaproteobacteria bacterium]
MASVEVRDADFHTDRAEIRRIRYAVFVDEQGVPESLELDDRDPLCAHVLAYVGGEAVGTGRLDLDKGGKIGRVAVTAAARRRGVGSAIMQWLHRRAEADGLRSVWCHAQVSAAPFYERLGYRITSDVFLEADIEHVRMERTLP